MVPNAYALQTSTKESYKHLWGLILLGKIKIKIWRISWNYLPTFVNMKHKQLVNNVCCLQCGEVVETLEHVFCACLVSI